ncbi:MAG: threonine/serine exporter family protein [Bacteroidales bacterium]
MGEKKSLLLEVGKFIEDYSAHMMGCGVHTSRVIRSTKRIGEALGYTVKISIFQKSIILALHNNENNESYNEVVDIPNLPISFEHNSSLSALSWEAYDNHLSIEELRDKYNKIISAPAINPQLVLILTGFANASFCRLFGGDWLSMGIVFIATIIGMLIKQQMASRMVNHYITFIMSAFIASLCASTALAFNTTSEIALATSVLYLVPGVPLINGVIDIVEGHILSGFSRLVHASLLIFCIAIGLSFTLLLVKNGLL